MQYAALEHKGARRYGLVERDQISLVAGDPISGSARPTGESIPLASARLLAPVLPSKTICVGLNYRDHAVEMGMELPKEPVLFLKPPTAVVGPEAAIIYPSQSSRVDYEAELAIVIGRLCRNVSKNEARDYIFGYTCANDVTARDLQMKDGQWTRAKSFDTFLPLGPYLVTGTSPDDLRVSARLNGQTKQSSTTSQLVFGVDELVKFISGIMTLMPGDVILTGTPPGVGPMQPGDTIEIEIDGIGTLKNLLQR